jgi:hypothetical protein
MVLLHEQALPHDTIMPEEFKVRTHDPPNGSELLS